jgi:protein-S-isoprenylcysteine O-methyltransferase Ste14
MNQFHLLSGLWQTKKRGRSELKVLDVAVIRVLSILLVVCGISHIAVLSFFRRERKDLGSVKASKPTGFILNQFFGFLVTWLPLIFLLLGAIIPSWVYGTLLNLSFNGVEYLQAASVPLFLIGDILAGWSESAMRQFMRPRVEVREKHELVTRGPYSHIRHPLYTSIILMTLAPVLLLLHTVLVIGFLGCLCIVYRRAVLEEELLASDDGFGQAYRDYMLKTGRFLPKLIR